MLKLEKCADLFELLHLQELLGDFYQKVSGNSDSSSGCGSVCPSYQGGDQETQDNSLLSDTKSFYKREMISEDFDESTSLGLGNSLSSNLFNVEWASQPQVHSSTLGLLFNFKRFILLKLLMSIYHNFSFIYDFQSKYKSREHIFT
jgi:hypothetical protein